MPYGNNISRFGIQTMPRKPKITPKKSSRKVLKAAKPVSRHPKTAPKGLPRELSRARRTFPLLENLPVEECTLPLWAIRYFKFEVDGVQSPETMEAKKRDLNAFMSWYLEKNGHLAIERWLPRDTQSFLNYLERKGRAATTINRMFATLRRFARWTNEQPGSPFEDGLPTRKIRELAIDEPDPKKLTKKEIYRLFKAADNLVLTETRKDSRPKRNRAVLSVLYFTGLRVSELVALRCSQYDRTYLLNVRRKGKIRSNRLYLSSECRKALDDYLKNERKIDDPGESLEWLILPGKNGRGPITRRQVNKILEHIAEEASKHKNEKINIHPHRLRHTFGAEMREKTGSDTETAALLGHAGLKYVGRYIRNTQAEREAVLESIRVEGE